MFKFARATIRGKQSFARDGGMIFLNLLDIVLTALVFTLIFMFGTPVATLFMRIAQILLSIIIGISFTALQTLAPELQINGSRSNDSTSTLVAEFATTFVAIFDAIVDASITVFLFFGDNPLYLLEYIIDWGRPGYFIFIGTTISIFILSLTTEFLNAVVYGDQEDPANEQAKKVKRNTRNAQTTKKTTKGSTRGQVKKKPVSYYPAKNKKVVKDTKYYRKLESMNPMDMTEEEFYDLITHDNKKQQTPLRSNVR